MSAIDRAIAITGGHSQFRAVLDDDVAVSIPDVAGVLEQDRRRRDGGARNPQGMGEALMRQVEGVGTETIAGTE